MTTTLVLPSGIANEIAAASRMPLETAAVLLVRRVDAGGEIRLLARSLHWVPQSAYIEQSDKHMLIRSDGYVPTLALAEADDAIPIWFHTHPGARSSPAASDLDRRVDHELQDLFQMRSGSNFYGTLIASPANTLFAFTGKLSQERRETSVIDRVWIVGDHWRLLKAAKEFHSPPSSIFDRNIRAFGPEAQTTIGDLRIAIVGAGGTGSAVAEQLVRLGVRNPMIFDNDTLSESNVTRVYGSTPRDIGRHKADVLRDHLQRIAPDLRCISVNGMITMRSVALKLASRDLVFGCTDDNAGRLVLSRLSTYLLTPVIDIGVLLSSGEGGLLSGIDGRITTLTPGAACLVCRNRIDLARAAAEMRTPEERTRLANEGYAPALLGIEPAVVSFTTAVAAAAVNELLDRLVGYGPPDNPTETLLRLHEREISTNIALPRAHHYCHRAQGKWGAGVQEPFLGQTWGAE